MDSLTYRSAVEMARMIREKKISPVELVQAHLDRIERLNPQLNAFVSVDSARALEAARKAEAAVMQGATVGPLHGVPVTIKSSIDVAGLRCEAGSKLRAGHIAEADAPLVARLKAAGAIVLGNTNVPEMLMAFETDNLLYGRTNSPWDLERTPGGSSGGEAAAIAAGCSAGGVGSDGAGSIRVPAHFSGICGLKPTPGRIPATGHYPPSLGPFALLGVVGPLARTVADLQLLFEAIAGPDKGDACAAPVPLRRLSEQELRKIRIGYFEDDGRTPVTPETRAAVRTAAEALKQQGFEVEPFRPEGLERARQLLWLFLGFGARMLLGKEFEGRASNQVPALMQYALQAPLLTAEELLNAWMERDQLVIGLAEQMEKFPVLLCPVCAVPAFRHGERAWTINGQSISYLDAMSYTPWFNLLGNPGVVVPVGRSPEGLPIGVQVVARLHEEEVALAVAAQIEQAGGGWQAPPLGHSASPA
ncbi:MAG: amidase [Acidobacteria bacterium]|nr:amidase [Acidobacteriota bacterium]